MGEEAICRSNDAADSSSGVRLAAKLLVGFPFPVYDDRPPPPLPTFAPITVGGLPGLTLPFDFGLESPPVDTGPRLNNGGTPAEERTGSKWVDPGGVGRYDGDGCDCA